MRLLSAVFLLPLVLGETLVIPQVEDAVKAQLEAFSLYADYNGTDAIEAVSSEHSIAERQTAGTYWYERIAHRGISPFNPNPTSYKVYRNVKDYGAKGDGVTDDTAAINRAISDGNRCAPGACSSSSNTNAVVYFPGGTYVVSSSIVSYYTTNLHGNPNNMPVLKATSGFSGFGVIDGAQYQPGGWLPYGATNIFWRQVRNFVIDLTAIPATAEATGIHWPTAQATSLQNIVFRMSSNAGTRHQGVFIESGSGGMLNDLVFYGGLYGAVFGNQQFTARNLTFYNAVTAINQIWDWGWTYQGISINNCSVGLDMATRDTTGAETVGSVTFFDSSFTNTNIAFNISRTTSSQPSTGGSLAIENVILTNVGEAIHHGPTDSTLLAGGSKTVKSWVTGRVYNPGGREMAGGAISVPTRPASLVTTDGRYYQRSKPSYAELAVSSFVSVRAGGARGDGVTDDTAVLQRIINQAASSGKVVYFDAGTYIVTRTLTIPIKSRIVGEGYAVIMSRGSFFADINNPKVVVEVGKPGAVGVVEWSDMMVSTQGAQAGAILIRWNIATRGATPSGMWDVHVRVGGTAGSSLTLADCPKTPDSAAINKNCISTYLGMHIAPTATGLYMENCWIWVADHDVDDAGLQQISIYSGRGMLVEATQGRIWLVGTGSEHFARYQYQFSGTKEIYAGQIQTETPYYQPNPTARNPFPFNATLDDPNFDPLCPRGDASTPDNCAGAWGLRVSRSTDVLVYGAGFYSFFDNYSTSCSQLGSADAPCQTGIVQYDGAGTTRFFMYGLNTVGAAGMVYRDTTRLAAGADNVNVFPSSVVMFRSEV